MIFLSYLLKKEYYLCHQFIFRIKMDKVMEQQNYITQLESENRQLKAQLREWLQESLETNFTPKDLKLITELEHLEALGKNFPNGCLFRVLIDADIIEKKEAKNIWAKHLQVLYLSPSWEQISSIPRDVVMMDFSALTNIIHPDDQLELFPIIRKSIIDCTLFNAESRYCFSDTETRWLQISTYPRHEGRCVVCDGFLLDITKRKESEQKLIAEKRRLLDFGNNIPNGAYFQFTVNTKTGEMGMSQLSDTWTEITGTPVADAIADVENLFATLHPNDLPILKQSIEKSAQTLCELNCEARIYDNNQKIRWIQIVSRPYRDKELVVGDGIVFDITKHKINEIELAIHRDELELMVDKRTEELTCVNEELVSANEELAAINEELAAISEELEYKNKLLKEEIIAREKVMHQLEDSETKLRNFIQQSVDGILIFDDEGRITEWNNMMEKITGLEKKDTIGKLEWELRWLFFPDEARTQEELDNLRQRRFAYMAGSGNQEPILKDFSIQNLNGESRHVRGSLFPIKMKDTCHFGRTIRDVTEKWKIELELKKYRSNLENMVEEKTRELTIAKEKAEESNRLKSSFLANMSHEVRTPLNAITGLLNILVDDPQISEAIKEYIDLINKNSNQLLRLIDDILDAAKLEAGQMKIRSEPVSLNDMMNEMCIIFKQQLKVLDKSLIHLEHVKNEKMDNCIVNTDPVRLRQIMQNLLSNSIKFTDHGYIHFGYRLTEKNMLEFFVEDSGIGIAKKQQDKIFLLFRQAELGNNRRYGGTGLGLTISRSLAQLMGGDMQVSSTEGKGATFTFTIEYHPCEMV